MMELEIARENYLRPNGHGGYVISASSLNSYARCPLQYYYDRRARRDPEAPQPEHLSATTYGSIVHHAIHVGQRALNEGREYADALDLAQRTFDYYWQPENFAQLGLKITKWLPRETFGGLRDRGRIAVRDYFELQRKDDSYLLALEYPFAVPLEVDGRMHTLHGFVDRLEIAKYYKKPYIRVSDLKTGRKKVWLRHNVQFTTYAFATTRPEFWFGWEDSGLEGLEHFDADAIGSIEQSFSSWGYALHSGSAAHREQGRPLASRRGRWIDLKDMAFSDAGWRNERDYARLALAIDGLVRACEQGVYPLNISGDTCQYCPFRHVCGGVGLPAEDEGKP